MTIIEDHGVYGSTCGYCKSKQNTFRSHGMSAHVCSVEDYQHLIDRGWRRSGNWMYQPVLDRTCCPPYTIRLDVHRFSPTKSQKKVERRLRAYLEGRIDEKGAPTNDARDPPSTAVAATGGAETDVAAAIIERAVTRALDKCARDGSLSPPVASLASNREIPVRVRRAVAKAAVDAGATHSCSVAVALAAAACKRGGGLNCGASAEEANRTARALLAAMRGDEELVGIDAAAFASDATANPGHLNFSARRLPSSLSKEKDGDEHGRSTTRTSADGSKGRFDSTESQSVPGVEASDSPRATSTKSRMAKAAGPRVKTLTVTTRPSAFDEEEYRLWRRYQTRVHGDDPSENNELGYGRFLVDTPLRRVRGNEERGALVPEELDVGDGGWVSGWVGPTGASPGGGKDAPPPVARKKRWVASPPSGFGSFHQQYRIDGKLVAVGVVDVLPYCLSSKYFFWDPDYAALSLGKLGVLREIEWVREASAHCPTLRYYYMGYYIHDCPKMRYKGEYKPSELRCAATGVWSDLDSACVRVLDAGLGFAPFAPGAVREEDVGADVDSDVGADVGASRTTEERDRAATEGCTLGLVEGNRLARAASANDFVDAAPLPRETKARLRARLGRWARAVGNAKESMVYLLSLDRLGDEAEDVDDDESDESDEEGEGTGEEDDEELERDAATARADLAMRV